MTDRAQRLFDDVVARYRDRPGVAFGRMMSSPGLRINGKIFAMLVRGRLVVKVPAARAAELAAAGDGVPFEPRPGRQMREWVVLEPRASEDGERLVDEAFTYVAALGKRSA
jgi:hypothetical protein